MPSSLPSRLADFPDCDRQLALDWLCAACARWLHGPGHSSPPPLTASTAVLGLLARCHSLEPLLHVLAVGEHLETPSAELADAWRAAYFSSMAAGNAQLDRLAEILESCGKNGIGVIVLKGLGTVAWAYGDPALRPMSDLDLLCQRADLAGFGEIARTLGYRTEADDSAHHLKLRHSDAKTVVELHFDVYDLIQDKSAFLRRAWCRRATRDLEGVGVPTLDVAMQISFAVAHLVHHDLRANLLHFLDLVALLRFPAPSLREEIVAVDLGPELELLEASLAALGLGTAEAARGPVDSEALSFVPVLRQTLLTIDEPRESPALGELGVRSWGARLDYARRLLLTRANLAGRTQGHLAPGPRLAAAWRSAMHVARSSWKRHRRAATGRPGELSIKRRVYSRR